MRQCIRRCVLPGAGKKRISGSSEPGSSSSKYTAEDDTTPVKAIPRKSKGRKLKTEDGEVSVSNVAKFSIFLLNR